MCVSFVVARTKKSRFYPSLTEEGVSWIFGGGERFSPTRLLFDISFWDEHHAPSLHATLLPAAAHRGLRSWKTLPFHY